MSHYWLWLVFSFRGRVGRAVYFFTILAIMVGNFAIVAISGANIAALKNPAIAHSLPALSSMLMQQLFGLALSLALGWAHLSVGVKRLHDINLSGWYLLLPLGVLIGGGVLALSGAASIGFPIMALALLGMIILGLIMLFKKGSDGENRFPCGPSSDGDGDGERLSKIAFDKESLARYALQSSAASNAAPAQAAPAALLPGGARVKTFGRRGVAR